MSQIVQILLVEDDPGDIDLTKEALEQSKLKIHLDTVEDGEKAVQFLRKEGAYSEVKTPDLIFLDLNLPKLDGREVLKEIKSDENLKTIPVIILSTSDQEIDILKSYKLGANCYVTKPVGFQQFTEIVQMIESFWFTIVKLPKHE